MILILLLRSLSQQNTSAYIYETYVAKWEYVYISYICILGEYVFFLKTGGCLGLCITSTFCMHMAGSITTHQCATTVGTIQVN